MRRILVIAAKPINNTGHPKRASNRQFTDPLPVRRLDSTSSLPSPANIGSGAPENITIYVDQNSLCQTRHSLTHSEPAGCRERPCTSLHPTSQSPLSDITVPPAHLLEHQAASACRHRTSNMVLHPISKRTLDKTRQIMRCPGARASLRAIR